MKKLFLFLALTFTFIACNDDDNNDSRGYAERIVGTWRMIGLEYEGQQLNLDCEAGDAASENYTFDFDADGSLFIYNTCEPEQQGSGIYTIQEDVLTMYIDDEVLTAHLLSVNESDRLIFNFDINPDEIFYGGKFLLQRQ